MTVKYDKYHAKNPITRMLMKRFLSVVGHFFNTSESKTVLEVGCGEGHLLNLLIMDHAPDIIIGNDMSFEIISAAEKKYGGKFLFQVSSIYDLPFVDDAFDMVLACEVLEHLENPCLALDNIARVTKKDAIFTVPFEPLWRILNFCSGRYVNDFGNTPGHVHHFHPKKIIDLVSRRFDILLWEMPLPWIAIKARIR